VQGTLLIVVDAGVGVGVVEAEPNPYAESGASVPEYDPVDQADGKLDSDPAALWAGRDPPAPQHLSR
jgi:hypothetical protein